MDGMTAYHDSHHPFFRQPFGAVPCGTRVTLRLQVRSRSPIQSVTLRLWKNEAGEERIPMKPLKGPEGFYEAVIEANAVRILWYYFIVEGPQTIGYYSKGPDNIGGPGRFADHPGHAYQITVYRPDFKVPEWFREGIMYQIFPDRFYRPEGSEIYQKTTSKPLVYKAWGEVPEYRPDPDTGKILNNDFFGGSLQGILEKLAYLKTLGVTILYLNPIFEAYSNHRYDVGDYKKVDPVLGNLQDFRRLCEKAAEAGISILLDGVFSHTGSDSVYFNKDGTYDSLGAYQTKDSPYCPWYRFRSHPEDYECWWDVKTLPNVDELAPSYLDYIIQDQDSVIRYWLKQGAKGWRLDVADELPEPFLKALRQAVKETDQDAVILGEVWEDASNKKSYGQLRSYLLGEELDTVMNYPFREGVLQFLLGHWDADRLHRSVMTLKENYPIQCFYSTMNLLGTHDVVRLITQLSGAPPDETLSREEQAEYRLTKEQRHLGVRRQRLAALIQMTFPGVPSIYYGEEAGMEGYRDPLNRFCFPWGQEDPEMQAWYRQLTALRTNHPALRTGEYLPVLHQGDLFGYLRRIKGNKDVFGYPRTSGTILVLVNRSRTEDHHAGLDLREFGILNLMPMLEDTAPIPSREGYFALTIKALSGHVYLSVQDGSIYDIMGDKSI